MEIPAPEVMEAQPVTPKASIASENAQWRRWTSQGFKRKKRPQRKKSKYADQATSRRDSLLAEATLKKNELEIQNLVLKQEAIKAKIALTKQKAFEFEQEHALKMKILEEEYNKIKDY